MKRLLLGLLFSGIFSCAVAQSEVCQPQLKALPDTDQLLKRGEWNIELNTVLVLHYLNGTYTYRVASWLALGEGAGLRVVMTDIAVQLFARIQTEVPQWKVSPFLILDAGGAGGTSAVDFIGGCAIKTS